jgi:hypothetical protein
MMQKLHYILVLLVFHLLFFQFAYSQHSIVNWNLSISVVDEMNNPIPEANYAVSYYAKEGNSWTRKHLQKKSDQNGNIHVKMESLSFFSVGIGKEGYYPAILKPEIERIDDVWVPVRDTFEIVLLKKLKSQPMYAKFNSSDRKKTFLPKQNEAVGYDLLVGDWVNPLGKGEVADLFFKASTVELEEGEAFPGVQYTVFTKGKGNGLIQVVDAFGDLPYEIKNLKLGQKAPLEGYEPRLDFVHALGKGADKMKGNLKDTAWDGINLTDKADGYWIRIRSKFDPNTGKATSAFYGKITSPIRVRPGRDGKLYVSFDYQISSEPNNCSVVWDRKTTLIPGYTLPPAGARYH